VTEVMTINESGGQKDDEQDSDDEWGMNIHGDWW